MSDTDPTLETLEDNPGFLRGAFIKIVVAFLMAAIVPARLLYPKDTRLPGLRFVVVTLSTAYVWVLSCFAFGTY